MKRISRRQFLVTSTGLLTAAAVRFASPYNPQTRLPVLKPASFTLPEFTPITEFFTQQIRDVPRIMPEYWALMISGLVETSLILTHQDLHDYPSVELSCTLACAGNSIGANLIGSAVWRGIELQTLLKQAALRPNARYVRFDAADGYSTCMELDLLEDAILAYEMNGEPLPQKHGFPLRLVIPGVYGYKMPKWIQRIVLMDTPHIGFWESRGLSQSASVQPMAAIVSPHHRETVGGIITLSGIAYAGKRDVTSVELRIDDGDWQRIPFQQGTRGNWSHWRVEWMPTEVKDYIIAVRAADSEESNPQTHHEIMVSIVNGL